MNWQNLPLTRGERRKQSPGFRARRILAQDTEAHGCDEKNDSSSFVPDAFPARPGGLLGGGRTGAGRSGQGGDDAHGASVRQREAACEGDDACGRSGADCGAARREHSRAHLVSGVCQRNPFSARLNGMEREPHPPGHVFLPILRRLCGGEPDAAAERH